MLTFRCLLNLLGFLPFYFAVSLTVAQAHTVANLTDCVPRLQSQIRYPLLPMHPDFRAKDHAEAVAYFLPHELQQHKVSVVNGRLIWPDGSNVNTHDQAREFVMDEFGNMYSENPKHPVNHASETLRHSSFLAGGPTAFAGMFIVNKGNLAAIYNNSGHYKFRDVVLLNAYNEWRRKGVRVDSVELFTYKRGPISVSQLQQEKESQGGDKVLAAYFQTEFMYRTLSSEYFDYLGPRALEALHSELELIFLAGRGRDEAEELIERFVR